MRSVHTLSGFTLIEMMVTVAIVLVTSGAGLASFIEFNNKQQVTTSVETIKTFIRTAQRRAQAQDTPHECYNFGPDPRPLYAYRVYSAGNTLFSGANCGVLDDQDDPHDGDENGPDVGHDLIGQVDTLVLPNGVTVTADLDVRFITLYGGVEVIDDDYVFVEKGDYKYVFQITNSGELTEGLWVE